MKVITKAKELAVHTFKLTINTNRYPKKLRHSLVDKLQIKSLEIYESLFEANRINISNKNERCEMITKAITFCDELNFFIELSIEISLLSTSSAGYWSRLVSDVKNSLKRAERILRKMRFVILAVILDCVSRWLW